MATLNFLKMPKFSISMELKILQPRLCSYMPMKLSIIHYFKLETILHRISEI
jgi:hypothetical protein